MGYLAEQHRKLLEQLMGAEALGLVQSDLKFNDPKVCRNMICGHCPHDLFTNTKMDLGVCDHTHSVRLKEEFEAAFALASKPEANQAELAHPLAELNGMRAEYERNILSFVDECDRRIRAAQRRLEKTPEENNKTTALMREIGEIQTAYETAMADVESLGEAGKVDQSMAELAKAEALKSEKQEKERELQILTDTSGASGHQKLRVCDICGAYLSILDSDRRLADHFGGKMHLGYAQLRQMMEEWKERPADQVPRMAPVPSMSNGMGGGPPGSMGPPQSNGHYAGPPQSSSRYDDRSSSRPDDRHRDRGYDDRSSSSRRPDDRGDSHRSSSSRYDDRDRNAPSSSSSSRRPYDDRDGAGARDGKRSRYD